jgi:peptidoglycan/LPS O-acetylase OafA/YrhL
MTVAARRPGTATGRRAGTVVADAAPPTRFRADIEGLRAVAVLLVVLSHAGVGAVSGGYIGVDVFFVISGFLITSLLIREVARTGRISLSRFYARRALRLLPASTLVLLATLAGAWLWLTPLRFTEFARDAAAGATYVSNLRFALTGTDYLASAETPSPLLHLWSLAVEEQFYLLWPALILVVTWRRFSPRALGATLAVLCAASLMLSVTETERSAPWAYFGAHTRVWELGLGALVALAAGSLGRLAPGISATLGWAGLAAIGAAALAYDDSTAYPGLAALLPVTGAALVLAGGCADPARGARLLLATAPMQLIGRLSYGWYLWHWPVLVIGPAALGVEASTGTNLLLCLGALAPAAVSLVLVENPVRRHAGLRSRPVRGIAVGAALTVGAAAAALLVSLAPPAVQAAGTAQDVPGAMATAAQPEQLLAELVAAAADDTALPANLTPPLASARADLPAPYAEKCHLSSTAVALPGPCAYGDVNAGRTVVLFGDSHAAQWFPALQQLAVTHGWRLLSRTKSSCSVSDVLTYLPTFKRPYTECTAWRRDRLAEFRTLSPDLIVVSSSFHADRPVPEPAGDETVVWRDGWRRSLQALKATGAAVSFLVDTPWQHDGPADCLAAHPQRIAACATPVAQAVHRPEVRAAAATQARAVGATVVDPLPWLCATVCPVVVGNLLVYRDAHHLTTGYNRMLAPLLYARLPRLAE